MLEGLEITILNLEEVLNDNETKRIDSEYFKKDYLLKVTELKSKDYNCLCNLSLIKGGKRLPLGEDFSAIGVPYIRAQDVKNGFIEYENSPKISEKLHLELKNYQTTFNDVLLTIVGNSIGDSGIVKFKLKKCNLTENTVKIISKKISPDFLFSFLQSKFGKFQIERETVGTAQPKLSIERIRKFIIPLTSSNFQKKVEETLVKSIRFKNQYQEFYTQAESLLLQEIGLQDFTPNKELVNIKSFKESFGVSGRLDAEYYQKKYDELIETINNINHKSLDNIVSIKKSIEPGSGAYQTEGIPFIRVSNITKFGISQPEIYLDRKVFTDEDLRPKKDTILLSKDGSVGIAYKVEQDLDVITSSALLHLTVTDKEILPDYLTLVLNSKLTQMQAERDAGGSIIQHWRPYEIKQVLIPVLPLETQQKIASLIQESFRLKEESENLLEVAKQAVEIAIEKEEQTAMKFIEKKV